MTKFFFSLLVLCMSVSLMAQDAEKSFKKAKNAYFSFQNAADMLNSGGKLDEASTAVEEALTYDVNKTNPDVLAMRGQIYLAQCQLESSLIKAGKTYKPAKDAALLAYESFAGALKVPAPSKSATRSAQEGLGEIQGYLNFAAGTASDAKDYTTSMKTFQALLSSHDILKALKKPSALDLVKDYRDIANYVVSLASQTESLASILPLLESLYANKKDMFDGPAVYNALYQVNQKSNPEKALTILDEGIARHPDDQSLLYTQINYYLGAKKLDLLIDKLKTAIAKDPKNPSLYLTLGSVYDQLATITIDGKDLVKGAEYRAGAVEFYNQAIDTDPEFYDAYYSLGVISFNRGAALSEEVQALSNDFTSAGEKKYAAKEKEMLGAFEEGLPYFQKAEVLNPNDLPVLTALSQIYTRVGNLEAAAEFKKRLETVQVGGKNATPYHKM